LAETGDIIVLDAGKTLSKLSRWSAQGKLLDKTTRPNVRIECDGVALLDAEGIGAWVAESLCDFAKQGKISAIIPIGHGAAVAAIRDGKLAFAPLDYEQAIPVSVMAEYRATRDSFTETGSPALPNGLNIGSQLHWLGAKIDGATLLPWAQFWSWFLCGVATSEVTSLGCHSDLWNPAATNFSAMAKRRGWADQFASMAKAGDAIGTLKAEFGLPGSINVHCGIHDSNAALMAARGFTEIEDSEATVLSTGTWFIAMRSAKEALDVSTLPEARDCLVNVDASGRAVQSSRFMGGREVELLAARIDLAQDQQAMLEALRVVLASGCMVLPGFVSGCGPFPNDKGEWINRPKDMDQQRAAIALYVALLADVALDLIGAKERLLIEGRFAGCDLFVRALATLRSDMQVYSASEEADVSLGALRLLNPAIKPAEQLCRVAPLSLDLADYKAEWHQRANGGNAP
jgi:sugar (pentulose or hexulose) kinase